MFRGKFTNDPRKNAPSERQTGMITLIAGLKRNAAAHAAIISAVVPFIAAGLGWLRSCAPLSCGAGGGWPYPAKALARPACPLASA